MKLRLPSRILGAAALGPAILWLSPALFGRLAPSFRDQGDFFFPVKLYTVDRLAAGGLPLWNPLSAAGEPWLANGQSGVFYPPTLFFFLPWAALAAGLFLLFHFAVGAWGAWRFLKEEAVSDAGALFGAAAFSACGFAASLSAYWNHFGAWAYLPGIAALARSGLHSSRSRLGLAFLVGLSAMAGSPELTALSLAAGLLFAWESRPGPERRSPAARSRRVARLAAGAALGLLLAAWVLFPMAELLLHSQRRIPLAAAERENGSAGLSALVSSAGFSGGGGNYYLSSLYAGPLLLFCAGAAFADRSRRRLVLVLCALSAAGIVIAMSGPPGPWLRSLPGLDRLRYPAKGLAVSFFGLAMLAGIGADAVAVARPGKGALLPGTLGAAALAAIGFSGVSLPVRVAGAAGICLLLCPLVLRSTRPGRETGLFETAAGLALLVSLSLAGREAFRFAPESEIRRVPQSVPFLARVPGRVLTPPMEELSGWVVRDPRFDASALRRQREALLGYTNLLSGVSTVRTAAPLATDAALRMAAAIDGGAGAIQAAGGASARLLWSPFQPAGLGSRKVGEFFRAPINPYRPRLSFVPRFRVEGNAARAWERAARGEIDWSREVSLEKSVDSRQSTVDREVGREPQRRSFVVARIAEDMPERVAADVTSDAPGVLVLTDLFYPGWKAEADGHPAELLRADGLFRAVALPAGSHHVVFRYRPASFYAGALVSLLALAACAAIFARGKS